MTPRHLVLVLLAGFAPACADSASGANDTTRPNFVFILADDLGWRDVGYAGSAYPTPRIDALARESLVFDRAYAASPSCSPTRAALLTGRHPARLHLTKAIRLQDYRDELEGEESVRRMEPLSLRHLAPEEVTFAEVLQANGYATGFTGKWHLGVPPNVPRTQGFDWTRSVGAYSASPYFPPYEVTKADDVRPDEYLTDRITDDAIAFLREHADRPFFLYVSHFAVHGPWAAKDEEIKRMRTLLDPASDQSSALYGAMIASLDEGVGRILDELNALELADRTIVIFTSDNGPTIEKGSSVMTSTAPLRGGKLDVYEGGLRVPMVVRWPGRTQPGETDTPVVSMDLFPTVLAAAGIALPEGVALDGIDLAPVFAGEALERDTLFFHVPHREMCGAVLSGDRKLVFRYFEETSELYDLAADPGEAHDLAAERPDEVTAMRTELFDWLEAVDAQRVIPRAELRRAKRQ